MGQLQVFILVLTLSGFYASDPCDSNPCKNGGFCEMEGDDFKCLCIGPYTGIHCEEDPCNPNPCKNNHTCAAIEDSYICNCQGRYTGDLCDEVLDPCYQNPCKNGGSCQMEGDGFKCECDEPYTGAYCEEGVECDCGENSESCYFKELMKVCICNKGYAQLNKTCAECNCGENSESCRFDGSNKIVCTCNNGYGQRNQTCEALESYKCDFENYILCPFLKNSNKGENWTVGSGKENSGDIGPSVDHTLGNENGYYLLVNLSASNPIDVKLWTISLRDPYCLRFFYHMYGAAVPTFKVYIEQNTYQDARTYFVRAKTQGDSWKEAEIYLNPTYSMKINGYKAIFWVSSYSRTLGDVALDDIELIPGKCPEKKIEAETLCTFDTSDCGYTASNISFFKWKLRNQIQGYYGCAKRPKFDHTLRTPYGGYWNTGTCSSTSAPVTTVLNSPVYAKPKSQLNCLHFHYWMDGHGGKLDWGEVEEAYLQVHVNFPDSTSGQQWIVTQAKNITRNSEWTYVKATVSITEKFQFQFTSTLKSKTEISIALDDVKLLPGNCLEAGFCDFEDDKCMWSDGDGYEEYNWIRKTGESRTNGEIGPKIDKTIETPYGSYVVFSTLGKDVGAQASLQSEFLPPGGDKLCLSFFYQMSGDDLGSLKIVRKESLNKETNLWLLSDNQGAIWKKGMVELKSSTVSSQVIFRGIIGKGQNGFMALDDIRIHKEKNCELTPPEAHPLYETTPADATTSTTVNPSLLPECDCGENSESCHYDDSNKVVCTCNEGYAQRNEKCAGTCFRSRDCLNGGVCRQGEGTAWFCSCRPRFGGDSCEVNGNCDARDPMCRVAGAECRGVGKAAKCDCRPGKVYSARTGRCEDECDSEKCVHGICELIGKHSKCKCDEGFIGKYCEERRAEIPGFTFLWIVYVILFIVSLFFLIASACLYCKSRRNKGNSNVI